MICRIARVFPESSIGRRHATNCPDCQEFFAGASSLEAELIREARGESAAPSIGFERRLATAVRLHTSSDPDHRSRIFIRTVMAAVAAIVVTFALFRNPSRPDANPSLAASAAAETQVIIDAAGRLGARAWTSLVSAGEFVDNNPLQDELQRVISNAKIAFIFLRRSFVPDSFVAQDGNG